MQLDKRDVKSGEKREREERLKYKDIGDIEANLEPLPKKPRFRSPSRSRSRSSGGSISKSSRYTKKSKTAKKRKNKRKTMRH